MTGKGRREPVITIDGPAGAGKSTVGRRLAEQLGYGYIDTGAMYRALALSVDAAGLSPDDDEAKLRAHLEGVDVRLQGDRLLLDGRDVTAEIRTPRISQLTSRLTRLRAVRAKITPLQRRAAAAGGVVLEGRDTGTVVCPDAEVKFYMDATLDERARRRQAQLRSGGVEADLATVRAEIEARDAQDTTRALAPLRKAKTAIEVDTSELTIEQVVERMLAEVTRRRRPARPRAARRAGGA
jgi:cytidylate kinase